MASGFRIPLPSGSGYIIFASDGQDRGELIQTLILDYWGDYIERNWLSFGDENSHNNGENRVKRLLDACGYFMLAQDSTKGIVSQYMDKANAIREVPISSCSEVLADALFSAAKHGEYYDESGGYDIIGMNEDIVLGPPKKKYETDDIQFNKIFKLHADNPGATMQWSRLDTDNVFSYRGERYKISDSVKAYRAISTKNGVYYASDSILIMDTGVDLKYYTQRVDPISESEISRL